MSRMMSVEVIVTNFDDSKVDAIMDAINEEWPDCDQNDHCEATEASPASIFCRGDGDCSYSLTNEELVDRIAKAVWTANDQYCDVQVDLVDLEVHPTDTFELSKHDYHRLINMK
jgi:hypothetical protein